MTPNTLFPGLPNYTGPTVGFFALLHHSDLFEWSHDVNERVSYVKDNKGWSEIPIRLAHMAHLPELDVPDIYAAWAKYKRIRQPAWAEYERIRQPALAEYERISQPAWAEYERIRQSALAKYEHIRQSALAEYERISQSAWAEYERIRQSAWAEYERIRQPALAEYERIRHVARPTIEAYVRANVPDCRWDGKEIVFD